MLLFIEIFTLACFIACWIHAIVLRPGIGGWFFLSSALLGLIRENFVIFRRYLYGFAPLTLLAGKAPLIAAIIWGYSIYVAICWAEWISGEAFGKSPSKRLFLLTGVAMVCLAFFYEPFLKLIGMAHWEPGTKTFWEVPIIALIGYPTMTWLYLLTFWWAMKAGRLRERIVRLLISIPPVSLIHVLALQFLKDALQI